MFGHNVNSGATGSSLAIQSGYNAMAVPNMGDVKNQFKDALTLDANTPVSEEDILKYAQMSGVYKAKLGLLRRLSKQKLNAARQIQGLTNTVINHAVTAATQEVSWERMMNNGSQRLAEAQLDIKTEQANFVGYSHYQKRARDLMNF